MKTNFEKELSQTHCHSELWDGRLACLEMGINSVFEPNLLHKLLPVYIYGLVKQGWVKVSFDEKEICARAGNLITYIPGLNLNTVAASDDFKAVVLYVTVDFATDNATLRKMLQTAYFPIFHLHSPVLNLEKEEYDMVNHNLHAMMDHLRMSSPYKQDALQTVYSLFLLDLMGIVSRQTDLKQVSRREENVFIRFIHTLQKNFLIHHDLEFYARSEYITTTYLSRIVKNISGQTVQDYISGMLLMEACSRLRYGEEPMSEIASHLNFSDQAAFSKFFSRHKNMSPVAYRKRYKI